MAGLADLNAVDARERMARGEVTAVELMEALLARIKEKEPAIGAFAFLDEALARNAAKGADLTAAAGEPSARFMASGRGQRTSSTLRDMPTENGTPIDAGRRPGRDATLVQRLRAAGGIVIGKTVTTELAYAHPGKTRNPHDLERTPGGSSSGSAAAVAAGMVPLTIGTQTFGSVIRPASFCGVVGFKPTHGLVPRTGVRVLSEPLDTVGVFARTILDAALLVDALAGYDPANSGTRVGPPPRLLDTALTSPPVTPALAFVRTPAWEVADEGTRDGFVELVGCARDDLQGSAATRIPSMNGQERMRHSCALVWRGTMRLTSARAGKRLALP